AQAIFNSTTPVVTLAVAGVPEPGTFALGFFALAGILLVRRPKSALWGRLAVRQPADRLSIGPAAVGNRRAG
ncbi:MAG: PEP-CTERM sorting domain-containing protein, partial [Acidobacteriota bacterium]|nr:PEP-CTERM sorting domain-containing protein [Acidobacteriota bacterium]